MTTCHDSYDPIDQPVRRIVVGIDGSAASRGALTWAAEQARCAGARLEAVLVYRPEPLLSFAFGDYPAVNPSGQDCAREDALTLLRDTVSAAGGCTSSQLDLMVLADPNPAFALTQRAQGASMLVVGSSHRKGLGVLLGSTASAVVRHATCPVAVVPASAEIDVTLAEHDRTLTNA
jgi:nucleotide-binding universal stress UspA family protein